MSRDSVSIDVRDGMSIDFGRRVSVDGRFVLSIDRGNALPYGSCVPNVQDLVRISIGIPCCF
ncbi:hypothetical protein F2Q69_00058473 [Brassica cretica]|uniref:Uncharacterized protein n=1 Tax=Brassica cretica TaxID=69181 RepID=A0A8S9RHK8_BRACR|nr:hypothetical protein F2Q69_00058473 [Brassica cretica]